MKILQTVAYLLCSQLLFAQGMWTWMKGDNVINQPGIYGIKGIPAATNNPGSRDRGISWQDNNGNFWLFGGEVPDGIGGAIEMNDLWKYNTTTNEWTWISGDNIPNQAGIYGTQGVATATNKPGSRYGCASWKDNDGNFWLFGGVTQIAGGGNTLSDLWKYNLITNEWTWMNGDNILNQSCVYGSLGVPSPTNKPGGRHLSASWVDNSGNLWLFGGNGGNEGNRNDLWKYNIATNVWTWVNGDNTSYQAGVYGVKSIASLTNKPGARLSCVTWKDANDNFWLFGGSGNGETGMGDLNDLWMYNSTTNQWTWVSGDNIPSQIGDYGVKGIASATNKPGCRSEARSWTDLDENFWLFGGYGFDGIMNDLWKYNLTTNEWTWINGDNTANNVTIYGTQGVQLPTNKPGGRSGNFSWVDDNNNLWLFGGYGFDESTDWYLNDLWKLDIDANVSSMNVSLGTDKYVLYGALDYSGCAALTPTITGGVAPYTYLWTSDDASVNGLTTPSVTTCNTLTASTININNVSNATSDVLRSYTVLVTDANGQSVSETINLSFINISCSGNSNSVKVKICHIQSGNPANCKTICVSTNAAQALLNNGSYLGTCLPLCAIPEIAPSSRQSQTSGLTDNNVFGVHLYPNPSSNQFKLILSRQSNEKIEITVYDMLGRGIKKVIKNGGQQDFYFGRDLQGGVYFLQIKQGENLKVIKFVKQ